MKIARVILTVLGFLAGFLVVWTARAAAPEDNFSILADTAYSETPPAVRPADTVADDLKNVPQGTPKEEINLVSAVLGLDNGLMTAIAKIESDFNPHDRTGSYIGLFQLSHNEFNRYGPTGGDILNARDNAIAAAVKIENEDIIFKLRTHRIPSETDEYLIHQQGIQGAEQHLQAPNRPAWQSMCATEEGKERGVSWCKKAIWLNTLPVVRAAFKTVEAITSGTFTEMWRNRVEDALGLTPKTICRDKPQPHPFSLASLFDMPVAVTEEKPKRRHYATLHRSRHHRRHYAKAN